ncbi:unnamed protein product [Notodromas monacha]|uniref:EF-hand domain-containing protein n=1 Tax=Notodromas monacha TaxID=399045 RepID=A0A7R9C025_9CRUS|nr:unnamed protein product [Notodromas monacha]CAG0923496.1 unnamed protein product [Notodromas monacha]
MLARVSSSESSMSLAPSGGRHHVKELPQPYYLAKLAKRTGLPIETLDTYHRAFIAATDGGGRRDGTLDEMQFRRAFRALPDTNVSPEVTTALFRAVDTNADGHVDFTDFVYAICVHGADLLLDKAAWVLKLLEEKGEAAVQAVHVRRAVQSLALTLQYSVQSTLEEATEEAMSVFKTVSGARRTAREHEDTQVFNIPLLIAFLDHSSKV